MFSFRSVHLLQGEWLKYTMKLALVVSLLCSVVLLLCLWHVIGGILYCFYMLDHRADGLRLFCFCLMLFLIQKILMLHILLHTLLLLHSVRFTDLYVVAFICKVTFMQKPDIL